MESFLPCAPRSRLQYRSRTAARHISSLLRNDLCLVKEMFVCIHVRSMLTKSKDTEAHLDCRPGVEKILLQ